MPKPLQSFLCPHCPTAALEPLPIHANVPLYYLCLHCHCQFRLGLVLYHTGLGCVERITTGGAHLT